jgi:hypothetical protein
MAIGFFGSYLVVNEDNTALRPHRAAKGNVCERHDTTTASADAINPK